VYRHEGCGGRPTNLTTYRGDLLNDTTCLQIAHRLHSFPGHVYQTEKVDLHLLADLVLGQSLERSAKSVARRRNLESAQIAHALSNGSFIPCVVDDDVNALEFLHCSLEGFIDGVLLGDIKVDEKAVGVVGVGK
jgi:hypothetical protein